MQETDANLRKSDTGGDEAAPFRVGLLPLPGFALMSYACTVEPLRAANLLSGRCLYDIRHFAADPQAQSSGAGQVVRCDPLGGTPALDLLLVVAGGDPFAFEDGATLAWLRRMAGRGTRIGGVSGGAVILSRAGLMEGRRMTVHWEHAAQLAGLAPDLIIERRLFVMDRDRVTCGGGTAPLDLMHALIGEHHGAAFARLVSDWFLHTDIRTATAPQRALPSDGLGAPSPHVTQAVRAMETHVADPLTLGQLAMMTGISERHLNRLFADAFGKSAMEYYRALRLAVARRLVTGSGLSIAAIADATGFATPSHFSNQYLGEFGLRPSVERQGRAA